MTISHGGESGIFSAVLNVKEAHRTISSLLAFFVESPYFRALFSANAHRQK
jgi:hypothetical protein